MSKSLKKHRRNIKRLAIKKEISLDESISKFYNNSNNIKDIKNICFSLKKKRNKGKVRRQIQNNTKVAEKKL